MQLEPGRLEAGFFAFNHEQVCSADFIVAKAYATGKKVRKHNHNHYLAFKLHPNRDRDLHIANNVVSQAIAKAMQ